MTLIRVNQWIAEHGWDQLSWRDNQGLGVWTAIAPPIQALELIREATQAAGDEHAGTRSCLLTSSLLPIAVGPTLPAAMQVLEERLRQLPAIEHTSASLWARAVHDLYDDLCDRLRQQAIGREIPHERWFAHTWRERAQQPEQQLKDRRDAFPGAPRTGAPAALPPREAELRGGEHVTSARKQQDPQHAAARDLARTIATETAQRFGVTHAQLPRHGRVEGQLVRIESPARNTSLAAVVTSKHVYVCSFAGAHASRCQVGDAVSLDTTSGQLRITGARHQAPSERAAPDLSR